MSNIEYPMLNVEVEGRKATRQKGNKATRQQGNKGIEVSVKLYLLLAFGFQLSAFGFWLLACSL